MIIRLNKTALIASLAACALASPLAIADAGKTARACLNCHEAADLKDADAEAVKEVLEKPMPPVHRRFAELTLEEVEAVLATYDE